MNILFAFFLLTALAYGEVFKISGNLITFEDKEGLLVSGCIKDCLALKKFQEFKTIDLIKVRKNSQYVGSIGSDVCHLVYKADSILGVTESKDQRAFCVFSDSSMIEVNSLAQVLISKKIVRP
jgi:hypothetical protein